MSRFLLLLVLLAVTAVTAQTAAKAAVCTTSGDPHTTTFDGVNTDFQGNGCFQYVSHSHLSIQCCQYPCNPRVTCIRNCVAKVFTHTLTYGWDATTNTYDTIMIDNVATPVKTITDAMKTAAGGVVLTAVNPPQEKNVLVTYVGNQLRFTYNTGGDRNVETSTVIPVTVVFAPRYLAVSLPTTEPYGYSGVTYGLCGKFDGNFQNDFTAKTTGGVDNTLYSIPSSFDLKGRINNAQTIAWGLANAVSADGSTPYTALQTTFHQYSAQSHRYIVTSTVPTATANDTAEQLANVNFNNLEDLESARTKCQASATSLSDADSKAQYENCVYDLAYTNDIGIALSNIEAAQTKAALTATPSSSGGSGTDGAKVAAIVVGCVAGVAILAAFVLFRKYRRAQSDLSRALVLRRSESNEQNTGGIALEENL